MILGHRGPRLDLRGRKRCSFSHKEPWRVRYLLRILSVSALNYLDRLNSKIDHLGGE